MAKLWILLASLFAVHGVCTQNNQSQCRCVPGDECWPSALVWSSFNDTLGGKLISTVPYEAPCHNGDFGTYDATACSDLQSTYFYPEPHFGNPSSIMAPYFTNGTCDAWAPASVTCTLGGYVSYSVNASGPEDFQKVINFTTQNNIRLTIKNTGHDYNGKGTGAGAVAIWTHNMKSMELIPSYKSLNWSGSAIKVGAGVQVHELYQFAHDNGLVAVGGICPTVGVAGGYTAGGGHGPLASKFGMGADNALEFEVVTGTGDLLIANATNNADLYWALAGGGGGTYGVVSYVIVKAHPDIPTSSANLTFSMSGYDGQPWDAVQQFQQRLPQLVDTGATALWYIAGGNFSVIPATGPNVSLADLQAWFDPTLAFLNATGIPYEYAIDQYDTFLDSYNAFDDPWNVSQSLIGGRLIPRSLVEQNASALIDAIKVITGSGATISGVCLNVSQGVPTPDSNAVNPYWRQSIYDAVIGVDFNYTDWSANAGLQDTITNFLMPTLEALTPNGGAYLNEADFQQPDYQSVFWGDHYNSLVSIKKKYDPDDVFYVITGVGSDVYFEDQSDGGRLCRVS